MRIAIAVAVVAVGGVGCAAYSPETIEENLSAPTFHAFVEALDPIPIVRGGEIDIIKDLDTRAKGDIDGSLHVRTLCLLPESRQPLMDAIERYCVRHGGRMVKGEWGKESVNRNPGAWSSESRQYTWCERPSDSRPLFGYRLTGVNRTCSDIKYLVSDTPEPTDRFVRFADKLGHRTPHAREVDRAVAESLARSRQLQAQARADDRSRMARLNIAKLGHRGTPVCRVQGQFRYEAIVEEVAGERMKVYVQRAYVPSHPHLSPGGFAPHIEWVHAADWFDCAAWR